MTSPLEIPGQPSSEDSPSQEEPKIVVDDDWKSRARAEKEALQQLRKDKDKTSDSTTKEKTGPLPPLPPASFSTLIAQLATQALSIMAPPQDEKEKEEDDPQARLTIARHMIDTLGVLEEKTKGNLTDEESRLLSNYLDALRIEYVRATKGGQGT